MSRSFLLVEWHGDCDLSTFLYSVHVNLLVICLEVKSSFCNLVNYNIIIRIFNQMLTQFDQSGSYTKLLRRSWKFHQFCILSSIIQWCYPKYWKSLCHFDSCLSMSIIIKIINFIVKNRIFKILLLWRNNFQYFG